MADMGLRPDRGHVKCSRVVGEVMGKLHPHGDAAIYDALVRMAQPFSLRLPLVDGHGNFGSLDDGPAAPRYTEARLAPAALEMTGGLDEDVVDFVPNYDNQLTQPDVLPAAFPNLLVNGASGIAVGMATNMAPHNLVEVVSAARHLISHPDATLEELMRFVPGPDLPTGGKIVGLDGIREAYATGRGTFRTRATTRVESITARRKGIVVTELPYTVGPEKVIEKIKDAVQAKKLQGVSAVTDLTDRSHGLRLVIEVKTGFNPDAVLEQLYRLTPMEDSFGINNVCLVEGQPRTLGLKELLQVYVAHRLDVVRRRTAHRLAKRRERLHLVEGLLVAILDIDEVIQVIRASDDAEAARARLIQVFDLSQPQAEYILELRLRRLTRFSRVELEAERDELVAEIARLEEILGDEARLRTVVSDELAQVAADLRDAAPHRAAGGLRADRRPAPPRRRSRSATTPAGCCCRPPACWRAPRAPTRPSRPPPASARRTTSSRRRVLATARGQVGVVTSAGRVLRLGVVDIPAVPPTAGPLSLAGGGPLSEYVTLDAGERVVALASLTDDEAGLALGTASGVVKRVVPDRPGRDAWEVISLKDGDEVVGAVDLAAAQADSAELVFVTSDAQLLRFAASAVRPQGRSAGGMAGVRLAGGARAVFFGVVVPGADDVVVTVAGSSSALPGTEAGTAKVTPLTEYPAKGRGTGGVRCHRFLRGEDQLSLAWVGTAPARGTASSGSPVDLPAATGRRDGSGTPLPQPLHAVG